MAIIVMNLLIGLAISSIEELVENGEKIQVFKRVEAMIAGTRLPSNTTFGNFEKRIGIIPDVKIMKLFKEANMTSSKKVFFALIDNKNQSTFCDADLIFKLADLCEAVSRKQKIRLWIYIFKRLFWNDGTYVQSVFL